MRLSIQYNTIQYNAIQNNTIQCNAIQYNTIQCKAIQYNTITASSTWHIHGWLGVKNQLSIHLTPRLPISSSPCWSATEPEEVVIVPILSRHRWAVVLSADINNLAANWSKLLELGLEVSKQDLRSIVWAAGGGGGGGGGVRTGYRVRYYGCSFSPGTVARISRALHWDNTLMSSNLRKNIAYVVSVQNQLSLLLYPPIPPPSPPNIWH